jgi:hypothetical protein
MEPTFTQKLRFFVSGGSSAAPLGRLFRKNTKNDKWCFYDRVSQRTCFFFEFGNTILSLSGGKEAYIGIWKA